ncbi:MAG: phosphate regulon sensor histidine kinase PhoR [Ferrovum sp.]|nr:phosphate regulon sensor histidine kinase PhoR [Ferrovum sp.]NDU87854.1 phosphate regulon sensor histidine kinase PhoR [Ferrovum sp.]
MKSFLTYILGVLFTILALCAGVTLFAGWMWGVSLFAFFMTAVAARDAWKLQSLHRWLQNQPLSTTHSTGRTWQQVFGQLHSLEQRFDENEVRLREALERFQQALALLPNGIVILDQNHRILWCNPSAEQHFPIHLEQDRGQSLPYLIRQTEFQQFLDAPAPSSMPHGTLHRRPDSDKVLSMQLVPYSDHERMLVTQDITQWERDERVRRDFVANVSHELRTPLTVIGGFIETMQNSGPLPPATQERILETMANQTQRMHRLVEELLSLSRLESQTGQASMIPLSLQGLLTQVLQTARQLSQGQHTLTTVGSFDLTVLGCESELLSAFGNLVANAVRYTPAGGEIALEWQQTESKGIFSVRDSGIGIEAEHIPRLTERFYRVDRARSRDTGGTGLGLAIVKQVAMHHDAHLEIQSEPGIGSTFSLHFPAARLLSS